MHVEQREVGVGVEAHARGGVLPAVAREDHDRARADQEVRGGEDTVAADRDAGSHSGRVTGRGANGDDARAGSQVHERCPLVVDRSVLGDDHRGRDR